MAAYYNEFDPFAASWLENLIAEGLIASGVVDRRSIVDVQPDDLKGYGQCHFFAGIGGWSLALRLAGVPDDEPIWTGSCPCQPFSAAGKRKGTSDPRHLWPEFARLIGECRPARVFGEQVASKDGRLWLTGVRTDLEALGYAVGAADLCAAGVSAPHVRQRLFWVADADGGNARAEWKQRSGQQRQQQENGVDNPTRLANTNGCHRHWWSGPVQVGWNGIEGEVTRGGRQYRAQWRLAPGLSLLAHGVPNRVATLRGAGNAIVPQVAAEFIRAVMECRPRSF